MTDTIETTRSRLRALHGRLPEIADRFGFSKSNLTKFANGERGRRPSFALISKLQAALDEIEGVQPQEAAAPSRSVDA